MTTSVPADQIVLDARVAAELTAVVRAALDNVARHAGADARAWVLLDHVDRCVQVTVRDDGRGMDLRRLDHARTEGRLGVSHSIHGRIDDLGGAVDIETAIGSGTTLRLSVPTDAA